MNSPAFLQEQQRIRQAAEFAAGTARRADERVTSLQREHDTLLQALKQMDQTLGAIQKIGGGSGNPDIQRIENIPGRRVPFDMVTEISIAANDTSLRTGTFTVSQEGPFVVVARMATFLSQYTFQDASGAAFLGRSNGRWRPIHSASDIMDAALPADVQRVVAFPGTGAPSYSSPALHAPYRSMEFDARIKMINQGASFPRSNIPVPSPFWTTFINSPFQLGALDFFARADVVEFQVQPQHVSNPNAGNLAGFGTGPFPFSDAQFDHHEGINDTEDPDAEDGDPDPITRLPNGTLVLVLHGYRIIQPPGAVVNPSAV